jgi:hypothetical protein
MYDDDIIVRNPALFSLHGMDRLAANAHSDDEDDDDDDDDDSDDKKPASRADVFNKVVRVRWCVMREFLMVSTVTTP